MELRTVRYLIELNDPQKEAGQWNPEPFCRRKEGRELLFPYASACALPQPHGADQPAGAMAMESA